ncbi:Uncharacterised protein [Serratia rubidaea]|uniref:Uncharacterized protein n=1 Tax=Serratia rubidaea TaxID=61652 RepID=A0A447QLA6_SERRU|nr:Uncharacterised protein [Serratia rubidaea]
MCGKYTISAMKRRPAPAAARRFPRRAAGGHHIIQQGDVPPGQISSQRKAPRSCACAAVPSGAAVRRWRVCAQRRDDTRSQPAGSAPPAVRFDYSRVASDAFSVRVPLKSARVCSDIALGAAVASVAEAAWPAAAQLRTPLKFEAFDQLAQRADIVGDEHSRRQGGIFAGSGRRITAVAGGRPQHGQQVGGAGSRRRQQLQMPCWARHKGCRHSQQRLRIVSIASSVTSQTRTITDDSVVLANNG